MTDSSQEFAEQRTDWAEDRTLLANERTFAGWMRTGMGAVGVGIALHAVFSAAEPTWLAKIAATLFVLTGIVIFQISRRRSAGVVERMAAHDAAPAPSKYIAIVAHALTGGAFLVGVILWVI